MSSKKRSKIERIKFEHLRRISLFEMCLKIEHRKQNYCSESYFIEHLSQDSNVFHKNRTFGNFRTLSMRQNRNLCLCVLTRGKRFNTHTKDLRRESIFSERIATPKVVNIPRLWRSLKTYINQFTSYDHSTKNIDWQRPSYSGLVTLCS